MRRYLVIAIVGVLAACGSSSSSSSSGGSGAYVDAAMKSYDDASSSVKDTFSRGQAKCLIQGIVDAVGVDTLKSHNVVPSDLQKQTSPFKSISKDLSRAQARDVASVITDGKCFNFADIVVKQVSSSGSNPFRQLSKTQVRCFFNELLKEDAVKNALASSILGQESSSSALQKSFGNQSKVFAIFSDCKIRPNQIQG